MDTNDQIKADEKELQKLIDKVPDKVVAGE